MRSLYLWCRGCCSSSRTHRGLFMYLAVVYCVAVLWLLCIIVYCVVVHCISLYSIALYSFTVYSIPQYIPVQFSLLWCIAVCVQS